MFVLFGFEFVLWVGVLRLVGVFGCLFVLSVFDLAVW